MDRTGLNIGKEWKNKKLELLQNIRVKLTSSIYAQVICGKWSLPLIVVFIVKIYAALSRSFFSLHKGVLGCHGSKKMYKRIERLEN